MSAATTLRARLAMEATAAGFEVCAVTSIDAIADAGPRLDAFLGAGHHGTMTWMATHSDRRRDPRVLWPAAQTAIVLAKSYAPAEDPIATKQPATRGVVSAYARGKDYHDVVKAGLKRVARFVQSETGAEVKVFVDTAPLMEKPLAAAAGLGWQGKHTNLVSREHGSWLFLGVVLTSAVLEVDAPSDDHCGSCTRCLDACPTKAFPAPYQLDARRCIAYLTIEHHGTIAEEFREAIGNRVFGCDDCLAVCPWNKFAAATREIRFYARAETDNPPLADLLALDDAAFRLRFAGTPVKRTGRNRIIRNTLIAAGNSGDVSLVPRVVALLDDAAPVVRAMAVWALARLDRARAMREKAARVTDADADVAREWSHVG